MKAQAQARADQGYDPDTPYRCGACPNLRWTDRLGRHGRPVRGDYRCGVGKFPVRLRGGCKLLLLLLLAAMQSDDGAEKGLVGPGSDDGAEKAKPRAGGA